jgi:predicted Zn-dependent peptidase
MEFLEHILPNGLEIVAECNDAAYSTALGFFVNTGARDENHANAGVSHFLEHMVFKGTARRGSLEVNRQFDSMGANYNAFTSEENTVFYGAVLPEYQDDLLDLLCDILRPSLRKEDFDLEKNVILDEIARYEDMPRYRVYEMLLAEYFRPHPLGHSVLGTSKSVGALTQEQMLAYFNRRYAVNNLTLVGVGNMDFDALVAKASQMCGHWPADEVGRDTARPGSQCGQRILTDPNVVRQQLALASPAPASQDADRYAAMLAATMLGDVTGSRLYYALVDQALADEATMVYDSLDGTGAFMTFLSCDSDQSARVVEIARREMAQFQADGPAEAELLAAKNKIASGATLKGEVPIGRLTAVGYDWVYRKEYVPLADQIETLFAVTAEQVVEVTRKYDLGRTMLVALGPLEKL